MELGQRAPGEGVAALVSRVLDMPSGPRAWERFVTRLVFVVAAVVAIVAVAAVVHVVAEWASRDVAAAVVVAVSLAGVIVQKVKGRKR